jgi:hypothetical protein
MGLCGKCRHIHDNRWRQTADSRQQVPSQNTHNARVQLLRVEFTNFCKLQSGFDLCQRLTLLYDVNYTANCILQLTEKKRYNLENKNKTAYTILLPEKTN